MILEKLSIKKTYLFTIKTSTNYNITNVYSRPQAQRFSGGAQWLAKVISAIGHCLLNRLGLAETGRYAQNNKYMKADNDQTRSFIYVHIAPI